MKSIFNLPILDRALLVLAGLATALSGCGGGVGTGGTGSFAQGPINGFGSVIVNEVRYDDTTAQVLDAEGTVRSSADLRLGMTVSIDSGAITTTLSGQTAAATRIQYASEMLGPLAAVDRAAGLLTLLGQSVQIDPTTVFDDRLAGGLAALAANQLVQVYALYDAAAARYRATRVEPVGNAASYLLRGVVGQLDTSGQSFRIGSAQFNYAGASGVPGNLANGVFLRMKLQSAAPGSTRWTVLSFGAGVLEPSEGVTVKVKGLISAFGSSASFSVNGQAVAAASAQFPNGSALLLGVRVEVEGTVQGGVLQATKVTLLSDQSEEVSGFELHGSVSALDAAGQTFTLRGVVVDYGSSVFKNGSAATLALNRQVEVKGVLSNDGTRVKASIVQFDN
jgi:hypothetical protein